MADDRFYDMVQVRAAEVEERLRDLCQLDEALVTAVALGKIMAELFVQVEKGEHTLTSNYLAVALPILSNMTRVHFELAIDRVGLDHG